MKAMLALGTLAAALATQGPARTQVVSTPAATPSAERTRAPVDLNTADIPTLESVPEIGTDLANAVVAGRPYQNVEHAARVLKLSPEKMATLRPKVVVSPPPAASSTPRDPRNSTPSKPPPSNDGKAISAQEVTERYDRAQTKAAAGKK